MGGVYGIRSTRVVLPSGIQPATVYVRDTRIDRVVLDPGRPTAPTADRRLADPRRRRPRRHAGHRRHARARQRARADGVGRVRDGDARRPRPAASRRIVDMPLNSVPATTTLWALDAKRDAARDAHVEVGVLGRRRSGQRRRRSSRWRTPACRGFKCFLSPSGVDEFEYVEERGSAARRCRSSSAAAARCSRTRSGPPR